MSRYSGAYHDSARELLDEFDPNAPTRTPWASYVPRRTPAFKMHNTRGPALTAVAQNEYAILFKWEDHEARWVEVARADTRLEPDPPACQHCGAPEPPDARSWYRFLLRRTWTNKRGPGNPVLSYLCPSCNNSAR